MQQLLVGLIVPEQSAPSTPPSGTVALYAKADGLLYSKDDAGAETLVSGGAGGGGSVSIGDAIGSATNNCVLFIDGSGNLANTAGFEFAGGALLLGGANVVRCQNKANASQSNDLHQWTDSSSGIYSRVNKEGYLITAKVAAPADGDLNNSEVSWWLDDTNGDPVVKFKGKDSGGNPFTFNLDSTTSISVPLFLDLASTGGNVLQLRTNNAASILTFDVNNGGQTVINSAGGTSLAIQQNSGSGPIITLTAGNAITIDPGSAGSLSFFNGVSPVTRPTTGISAASFTANSSGIADDSATWGGYTIGQVVAALKALGLLT